ncbi:secretory calcium-binding phosphoprotein 5 [Engraulis encrasicolus]|uniref:secretory calcium-binding phosphoprotein 5 n=1 Tax=Engraulis encrasicolus TaxID=184585 RepID=UPI002FD41EC7
MTMWTTLLCLCFSSAVSAAPLGPFFNYLPQYDIPRQAGPTTQVNNVPYTQAGFNGPVSMEIVFPQRYPANPAGGRPNGPVYPSQAFIKYSLPKIPGRKSVEVYYPYDFGQQQQNFPTIPQMPPTTNLFPFNLPPQTIPQQPPQIPPFQPGPLLPQETVQQQQQQQQAAQQQEQQAQAGGTLP